MIDHFPKQAGVYAIRHVGSGKPLAASNRGRKASPQEVERNRLARLGKKQSPELIERRIAPRRGVPLTENHRRAISQGKLARKTRRPDIREWAPRKFARFEPTTVDVIRAEKAAGASYRMLAARYQCSVATLHRLVHGIGPLYSSHKPC